MKNPSASPTAATSVPAARRNSARRVRERFLVALARALHRRGVPAPRLEAALTTAGATLRSPLQILATPTALQLAFETGAGQRVVLVRQDPAEVDLDAITALDEVLDDVVHGDRSAAEGIAALEAIERRPPPYGPAATIAAFAATSGTAAQLFGGAPADVGAAALLGGLVGVLARVASRREGVARLFEPVAALAATLAAGLLVALELPISRDLVALTSLVVLLPGFTVTVAMTELAEGHLSAGTSRLFGAGITFLSLGLGVALAQALLGPLSLPAAGKGAGAPPVAGADLAALLLAPVAFGVLFRARPRHLGWIVPVSVLGVLGARGGALGLGPELGSFTGALVVGLAGNALARTTGIPTMVCHVPGILLLVPGSVGFRSFVAFLADDALSGTETAFRTALVAGALAAGLLVATVVLPPTSRLRPRRGREVAAPAHDPASIPPRNPLGTPGRPPRDSLSPL